MLPSALYPMKFCATAAPIATPTPRTPPTPIPTEAAMILASMSEVSVLVMLRSEALLSLLAEA